VGEKDLFKRIKKRVRANNAQDYLDDLKSDAESWRRRSRMTSDLFRHIGDAHVGAYVVLLRRPVNVSPIAGSRR
jgi:hypothetical protein